MMRLAPSHRAWLCGTLLLGLAAGCGGSSSVSVGVPTDNNGPVLIGLVSMPNGRLAAADSPLRRFAAALVARAEALVAADVIPVGGGVEVRLRRIGPDNVRNGAITGGDIVNRATTRADGTFALRMPVNTDPGTCRFVLEVGSRGDRNLTRAFVDAASVDVDFESEATVRLLLAEVSDGRAALCDLSAAGIRSVRLSVQQSQKQAFGNTAAALNASAALAAGSDPGVQASIDRAAAGDVTPSPAPTNTMAAPTATAPPVPTRTTTTAPTRTRTPAPTSTAAATRTHTPAATNTPVPTNTVAATATGTNTAVPTNTLTRTETLTPTPSPTSAALGSRNCSLLGGTGNSALKLGTAALPLELVPAGTIQIACGAVDGTGKAPCSLSVLSFSPVVIPAIGDVCVNPAPCSGGEIDCDGGTAANVDLVADHNIGTCTSDNTCRNSCDAYCAAKGVAYQRLSYGCEAFCQGGTNNDLACTDDSQCPGGSCSGNNPPGHAGKCNCACQAQGLGGAGPAGTLRGPIGTQINVELPSNGVCDQSKPTIQLAPLCGGVTTATASGQLKNANNTMGATLPPIGGVGTPPNVLNGVPLSCSAFAAGTLTGARLVGHLGFFDTTLGDIFSQNIFVCQ